MSHIIGMVNLSLQAMEIQNFDFFILLGINKWLRISCNLFINNMNNKKYITIQFCIGASMVGNKMVECHNCDPTMDLKCMNNMVGENNTFFINM
jgi:hypothetical protein